MSDIKDETNPDGRREHLMAKAKLMGLKVSPNIGVDALAAKVKAALEAEDKDAADAVPDDGAPSQEEEQEIPPEMVAGLPSKTNAKPKEETENEKRSRLLKDATRLVRIRLTCMNPAKKDLHGEIFTVGNKYIGTIKKFVPFVVPEDGYHVPHCIYEELKNRKFLHIQTANKRTPAGEVSQPRTSDVAEFAIEVLPQLTAKELAKLAQRQAMAAGTAPTVE